MFLEGLVLGNKNTHRIPTIKTMLWNLIEEDHMLKEKHRFCIEPLFLYIMI